MTGRGRPSWSGADPSSSPGHAEAEVEVRQCPGGPVLVRGATVVRDSEGTRHPVTRPVVAVCQCGLSQRAPWCDGTHKFTPRYREATQPGRRGRDSA